MEMYGYITEKYQNANMEIIDNRNTQQSKLSDECKMEIIYNSIKEYMTKYYVVYKIMIIYIKQIV